MKDEGANGEMRNEKGRRETAEWYSHGVIFAPVMLLSLSNPISVYLPYEMKLGQEKREERREEERRGEKRRGEERRGEESVQIDWS
jgi:hypothetical protein